MDMNSLAYHNAKMRFDKVFMNQIPNLGNDVRGATAVAKQLLAEPLGLHKAEGGNLASFTRLVAACDFPSGRRLRCRRVG